MRYRVVISLPCDRCAGGVHLHFPRRIRDAVELHFRPRRCSSIHLGTPGPPLIVRVFRIGITRSSQPNRNRVPPAKSRPPAPASKPPTMYRLHVSSGNQVLRGSSGASKNFTVRDANPRVLQGERDPPSAAWIGAARRILGYFANPAMQSFPTSSLGAWCCPPPEW